MSQNERGKSLITLRDIVKQYHLGKTIVPALQGVDLDVARGEFTVVMGPSGSGKSTLLNIIGCLDSPTSGTYQFDGQEVGNQDFDKLAELRNRKIGIIFQSFNLIPVLNVIENVEFPCLMRKNPETLHSLRERVVKLCEDVGLGPFLQHRPDELSGGQRQRVAIARALITHPDRRRLGKLLTRAASNGSALHQETHPAHAIPFVCIEPECERDLGWQRVGVTKPDGIDWLTLVFELERQVFFAHQPL